MSKAYLIDMDGVLVNGAKLLDGAVEFIERLRKAGALFLLLTNNSRFTPHDLQRRLCASGLDIPVESIFTSALATAQFLRRQRPGGSAYIIGEDGLIVALEQIGYKITDQVPDYVVIGETTSYSFERITKAVRLIKAGARFIATNPDVTGPAEDGVVPTCGAVAAMITAATGIKPYFIGKPNPLMMRSALRQLGAHSENTLMIGDRMDTDIIGGIESGMETILVLTGVTRREKVDRYPYKPDHIRASVADIHP
ncbi:acid sugar phosphatase [Desulforhabdus amnigena]|uniref:Acid sugar phosphatase n=1 Tax=Desulforhabdus amnigena TaxID=40218 RepID=A0A9W6FUC0_9BACT|nr:HAD-IIA family hydrolase [Desulforhabdus amnigena]GLI35035.1 acid sugar phosphatase [Desulforhabdus amnigena]